MRVLRRLRFEGLPIVNPDGEISHRLQMPLVPQAVLQAGTCHPIEVRPSEVKLAIEELRQRELIVCVSAPCLPTPLQRAELRFQGSEGETISVKWTRGKQGFVAHASVDRGGHQEAIRTLASNEPEPAYRLTKDGLAWLEQEEHRQVLVGDRATRRQQQPQRLANELTDRQRTILQALRKLHAFDRENRKTTAEVARTAEGRYANPENFKKPVSGLSRRGLVETKRGGAGGVWLSIEGRRLVEFIVTQQQTN